MKKLIISVLSVMLMLSALCFTASAGEKELNELGRAYYTQSDEYKIVDGVVYSKINDAYAVVDFFATDELTKNATEINIVSEIDGIPVKSIETNPVWNFRSEERYPSVTKINLPDTLETIGECAFIRGFTSVTELEIPESVTMIYGAAFEEMTSLQRIVIPEKVPYIASALFHGCTSLSEVVIKGRPNSIGEHAFYNCKSLKAVEIADTVKEIGYKAFEGSGIEKITIPALEFADNDIFKNCKSLKEVTINGVESKALYLHKNTFKNCTSLEKVTFGDSAEKIHLSKNVFSNCNKLKGVYFTSLTTEIYAEKNAFGGIKKLPAIYFAGSEKLFEKLTASNDETDFSAFNIKYLYNHTHVFKPVGEFAESCKEGTTVKLRCICETEYTYVLKSNNAHKYTNWETVKKPTLKEKGKKERYCTVCDKTETKTIAKLKNASKFTVAVYTELAERVYNNGKPVELEIAVSYGKKELKKGVHYTVSYKNNKEISNNAYIIIKGIPESGYGGTKKVKFSVLPDPVGEIKKSKLTSSSVKLSWEKPVNTDGYIIYKVNIKNGKKTEIGRTEKTSYTVKNLKSDTLYRFEIRSYVNIKGEKVYSPSYDSDITIRTKK